MGLIRELWRGNVPLSRTFWGFLVGVILLLEAPKVTLAVDPVISSYARFHPDILTTVSGVIFWILLFYWPFILIAIWRSANKYQGLQRYAILAKIFVIVGWRDYFLSLTDWAFYRIVSIVQV